MKVLVACEESQTVCKAFRAKGHEAYSCDIQEPSGGKPEWHILGDALKAIKGGTIVTMDGQTHDVGRWDLLIAHPPCTYLTNAGAVRMRRNGEIVPERCGGCLYDQVADVNGEYSFDCEWKRPLTRPPQSWCYVEELK